MNTQQKYHNFCLGQSGIFTDDGECERRWLNKNAADQNLKQAQADMLGGILQLGGEDSDNTLMYVALGFSALVAGVTMYFVFR